MKLFWWKFIIADGSAELLRPLLNLLRGRWSSKIAPNLETRKVFSN